MIFIIVFNSHAEGISPSSSSSPPWKPHVKSGDIFSYTGIQIFQMTFKIYLKSSSTTDERSVYEFLHHLQSKLSLVNENSASEYKNM